MQLGRAERHVGSAMMPAKREEMVYGIRAKAETEGTGTEAVGNKAVDVETVEV